MPVTRAAAYHRAPLSPQDNKANSLVQQASESSASLVVSQNHTSASLSGAPLCAPTENRPLFHRMVHDSIYADGREIKVPSSSAAQNTKTTISIEIRQAPSEHSPPRNLYNSNMIIDLSGTVAVHRKFMPSSFEKLA
ncbi:uncharacterized protein N7503_011583 [Penicillium pulvis]|uniref:uncharacterized protein n=1 Tax=Penicillium pulvis TaxID=1562058 RepID=UPI0025466426|nr:uncharacterized protein N7503_011583 [Penicillium pulvis]KAJ5786371.1 hypothetical protein N7503_011583 [Penicillium pulvis]